MSRIVPTGPEWAYEIKHDGFRFISLHDGKRVRAKYPPSPPMTLGNMRELGRITSSAVIYKSARDGGLELLSEYEFHPAD